ncbi:hypothetical protein FRC06_008667 [Ceratobasidium sp. 370]|nr:hypothetical protein FRC06_008667 [Ceratobasidium sp. 370]
MHATYCHSCETLDTPKWRDGPDGQDTLCNTCGLRYAVLVRRRNKATTDAAPLPAPTTFPATARLGQNSMHRRVEPILVSFVSDKRTEIACVPDPVGIFHEHSAER